MRVFIVLMLNLLLASFNKAQTPFEVSIFQNRSSYFAYTQRDIDSAGKWNLFSQGNFTKYYTQSANNSITIDNLLSRQITRMFGITAGASFDGQQLTPAVGLSLEYLNPAETFYFNFLPSFLPTSTPSFDFFLLVQYTPQFNERWGLFFQLIATSNHHARLSDIQVSERIGQFPRHRFSQQLLRAGINYSERYQFGLAIDFSQQGSAATTEADVGVFLRLQLP